MQLRVSVNKLTSSFNTEDLPAITAVIETVEDITNLPRFFTAIYSGEPIEFITDNNNKFFVDSGFSRYKFIIRFSWTTTTVVTQDGSTILFGEALKTYGMLNISSWISDSFREAFPNRAIKIEEAMKTILSSGSRMRDSIFVIACYNGEIVSLSSGINQVNKNYIKGAHQESDSYILFGLPTEIPSTHLPLESNTISYNYRFSSKLKRIVIGRNYFRYNAYEMTRDGYSFILNSDNLVDAIRCPVSVTKKHLYDKPLYNLFMDDTENLSMATVVLDFHVSRYTDYGFSTHRIIPCGLVFNADWFGPSFSVGLHNKYFTKLTPTLEQLNEIRQSFDTAVYTKSVGSISFSSHISTNKNKLNLTECIPGILGNLTKSTKKNESDIKAFKTRVLTSMTSYLLSICYSVVLHKDLKLPDDCYVDTFSLKKLLCKTSSSRYESLEFNVLDYLYTRPSLTYLDANELETYATKFINNYNNRNITISPYGGLSVISNYFYNCKLPIDNYTKNKSEFGWLIGLDFSSYVITGKHFAGFARGKTNGMNLDTQAISAKYFLGLLRFTKDWSFDFSWNTSTYFSVLNKVAYENYKIQAIEYEQQKLRNQHQFYLDNIIPNPAIESSIEEAIKLKNRLNIDSDQYIKYQEIFNLEEDSISILSAGYKCKDLESLFAWWSSIYPMLCSKVDLDLTYSEEETTFVKYLLTSTNNIIVKLTDKVDQFS